jgi:hypothetical protein
MDLFCARGQAKKFGGKKFRHVSEEMAGFVVF